MKEYIKIAWRNLWRNKRRTIITSASILFAVFFALIMRSFQLGSYGHMIKNAIESYSGFIQIQHKDYKDDPSLENSFPYNKELISKLKGIGEAKAIVPRVETFALASSGPKTKAAMVLGVDLLIEKGVSNPEGKLVRFRFTPEIIDKLNQSAELPQNVKDQLGNLLNKSYSSEKSILLDFQLRKREIEKYLPILARASGFKSEMLKSDDDGVLISSRLANYLQLMVGDTLVLLGQGYHGATAAGLYPIRGLVKFPNPELDNKLVYMTLDNAQYFANLDNHITSLAVNLHNNSEKNMFAMQDKYNELLEGMDIKATNWQEFNKVLMQQIEGDNQGGVFMLALLYFIIFFGIIGTVLMMIHERNKEFGVLVSIGMRKTKLAIIIVIEMVFLGILGVISGMVLSLPIIYILYRFPIKLHGEMAQMMESYGIEAVLPLAWLEPYIFWQGLIVALMVVMSCIVPLRKVFRLEPVKALRS